MDHGYKMIERDFYNKIADELKILFANKAAEVYLEASADNGFSFDLMIKLWAGPPGLLTFLKLRHGRPDLAGFIKTNSDEKQIIMGEVKGLPLKLDDIYQLRKYVDLFNASYAFLITSHPIPDKIKRLIEFAPQLIPNSPCKSFALVQFNPEASKFVDWYPANPFLNNQLWQEQIKQHSYGKHV